MNKTVRGASQQQWSVKGRAQATLKKGDKMMSEDIYQGCSQDLNKGVCIKIARLRAAKFLQPRPQIGQIVRSTHARTALFQIYVTVILQ